MNRDVVAVMRGVVYPEVVDIPGFDQMDGGSMVRLITRIACLGARSKRARCK